MLDVQTQENPHSAMCSYWLEGQFSSKSGKQYVISASAMEAEFVACIEATIQSLWWNFMTDLQIIIEDIL